MYKEIDQEFIIRTLRTYDARTIELRKEMSAQYTLLNTQSLDDELLQAAAYPIYDPSETRHQMDGDIGEIYTRYIELSKQRVDDIKSLMRDIIEEQESMNRIMAIYEILDEKERCVLERLYLHSTADKVYESVQQLGTDYNLHPQTIYRIRRKTMDKIMSIYKSDLTQTEILQMRTQDGVCLTNKEKYR